MRSGSTVYSLLSTLIEPWPAEGIYMFVSRQLQAVDCDVDGGIVMKEIAVGLCVARGLLSSLSRNSHIEVDNQAIIHSSF
jgi:hypothetical protein